MSETTDVIMKQKTIKTDKATLLVCEFPEYYRVYHRANGTIFCSNVRNKNAKPVWDSLEGNWQLLGRMPEITEFQKEKIVGRYFNNYHIQQKLHQEPRNDMFWVRHPNGNDKFFDTKDECYSHAIDMEFKYLLQANEVYFENPIPPFMERLEDFKEAQSKVWDKERTYLFIKAD